MMLGGGDYERLGPVGCHEAILRKKQQKSLRFGFSGVYGLGFRG